jgi:hypothetical protein
MSARDRIIDLLMAHPDGLDDDLIAEKLGFSQRQQANSRCRELEREGIIARRSVAGKIRNILTGGSTPVPVRAATVPGPADVDPERPWCWEGIVVRAVAYLSNIRLPAIDANEDGPNVSGGLDQRVQYGVKRVMHHVACELPVVYFQFDSDDAVASLTVNVRLVAANIRKPKTDSLHVEVARAEPVAPPPPPEPGDETEE